MNLIFVKLKDCSFLKKQEIQMFTESGDPYEFNVGKNVWGHFIQVEFISYGS